MLSDKIAESRPAGIPLVLLADGNGRLGSVTSFIVGPFAVIAQDFPGGLLHAFLAEQDLLVPAAFEAYSPSPDSWTWCSSTYVY